MDTYARTKLTQMSFKQTVSMADPNDREKGITISADRVVLDLMAFGLLRYYHVVRITDPSLVDELGLKPRAGGVYDISEFKDSYSMLRDRAMAGARKNQRILIATTNRL